MAKSNSGLVLFEKVVIKHHANLNRGGNPKFVQGLDKITSRWTEDENLNSAMDSVELHEDGKG